MNKQEFENAVARAFELFDEQHPNEDRNKLLPFVLGYISGLFKAEDEMFNGKPQSN